MPCRQQRLPLGSEVVIGAQRGHRRVCHGDWTAVSGLHLTPHVELGGSEEVTGGTGRLPPGRSMQPVLHSRGHEAMPRRMELDLVDAIAVTIVGLQDGWVPVRLGRPLLSLS